MDHEIAIEIRQDVKQLLVQSAVHNQILAEHKNFSIALQKEQAVQKQTIAPLIEHVSLMNKLGKGLGAILIVLIGQALVRLLLL